MTARADKDVVISPLAVGFEPSLDKKSKEGLTPTHYCHVIVVIVEFFRF